MQKLYLWAFRFSIARGWGWDTERSVSSDNADQWLKVFQEDEPDIVFRVGSEKPKENPLK